MSKKVMTALDADIHYMGFLVAFALGTFLVNFGLFSIAYGQEWNTTQTIEDSKVGTLMKHKGQFYCYDETTTTKKEVLKAIKHDWIEGATEIENDMLTGLATPDNPNNMTDKAESLDMAKELCQNMVANGNFANDDYNDYIEATVTWEFDWDD